MVDTWDIEAQRRRTGARALVTVFSDARALLESVIEDEFVGSRTHASLAEVQGAGPEHGLCARVCFPKVSLGLACLCARPRAHN